LEARTLSRQVHAAIVKLYSPESKLVRDSTQLIVNILRALHENEESEQLCRQSLQIALQAFGPRHRDTLHIIGALGITLGSASRGQLSEGEKLLSIALQLYSDPGRRGIISKINNMSNLSWILNTQGRFEEAKTLSLRTVEQATAELGLKHKMSLMARRQLASDLSKLGQLKESEAMIRTLVQDCSELLGEKNIETINDMERLTYLLYWKGNFQEAAVWARRVSYGRLVISAPEDNKVRRACRFLGHIYQEQGKWVDALQLYRDHMEKVRASAGDSHPFVAEVQSLIEVAQEHLSSLEAKNNLR
jgi:tetratricopeptide (TPR) repeat protein